MKTIIYSNHTNYSKEILKSMNSILCLSSNQKIPKKNRNIKNINKNEIIKKILWYFYRKIWNEIERNLKMIVDNFNQLRKSRTYGLIFQIFNKTDYIIELIKKIKVEIIQCSFIFIINQIIFPHQNSKYSNFNFQ